VHAADALLQTLRFGAPPSPDGLATRWRRVPLAPLGRLVTLEGCAVWLHRCLHQRGLASELDPAFAEQLAAAAGRVVAANLIVEAEAQSVHRLFADAGIPFILMKGVARRAAARRYPLADARRTNDVDILVPEVRAREAWELLRAHGYDYVNPKRASRTGHHHLASVWGPARVAVEVHTSIAGPVPATVVWDRMFGSSEELDFGGLRVRVPSATELCWGSIAHALVHPTDAYRLALLLDPAVIWASGAVIDWTEIRRRLDAGEAAAPALAARWLGAVAALVDRAVPAPLGEVVRAYRLDRVLRWRLDVLRLVPLTDGVEKAVRRATRHLGYV
jgi:hypothetical protein